jgi:T5SS/PEP-CTERM-associated repeat protein
VGSLGGSNGTISVNGTGSTFAAGATTVGAQSIGTMTVAAGGTANTVALTVGSNSTGQGELTVTGESSTLNSTGNVTIGSSNGSRGKFNVLDGADVVSPAVRIALNPGSTGSATVAGAGSTWAANTLAIGGNLGANGGAGTLTVANGGAVNVVGSTEIRSAAGTSLTIDGGSLTTSNLTRLGTLNHRNGTLHVKGTFDNGAAAAPLIVDGDDAEDLATLRLSGNFAVQDVTTLTVGNNNQGALVVDGGRDLDVGANNINIAATPSSSGTVTVSGLSSSLRTTGVLAVGGNGFSSGGSGLLNIGPGSLVTAGTLSTLGVINIDGGALSFGTFLFGSQSEVNFNSGQLSFTAATTTLNDATLGLLLGADHILGGRQALFADTLILNAPLIVDGGMIEVDSSFTNASALRIDNGSVIGFTNNSAAIATMSNFGQVQGGINNSGTIQLQNNLVPLGFSSTIQNNGVLRGTGLVGIPLSNNAAGQVQVIPGNRIEFQAATNTNSGLISVTGGEVAFTGALTNGASTGLIAGHDGIVRVQGGLTNNGALAFSSGSMDVFGDVTQNVGGRITVSGGGTLNFYDDVSIAPGAANVQATSLGGVVSKVVFFGSYNGGVTGGGPAFIEGDHRPGNSPALVTFGGSVIYGSASTLLIEIAGTTRGTQYDAIDSSGIVSLAGQLDVDLLGGFTPAVGDTFNIISTAGGVTGQFTTLASKLPALGATKRWSIEYTPTNVLLKVLSAAMEADFDEDGDVDGNDLTNWKAGYGFSGPTTTHMQGDADSDLDVDGADYLIWQQQLGSVTAVSGVDQVVPEPAAALMLIMGMSTVCSRRARPSENVHCCRSACRPMQPFSR